MDYRQELRHRDDYTRNQMHLTLNQASDAISKRLTPAERPLLIEKERVDDTYSRLLAYMAQGGADPSRATVVSALREDLLRINDKLFISRVRDEAPGQWWSAMRVTGIVMPDLEKGISEAVAAAVNASLNPERHEIAVARDKLYADLFDAVWTECFLTPADTLILKGLLNDPSAPESLKILIASAIVAGSMKVYDRAKVQIMAEIASSIATVTDAERLPQQSAPIILLTGLTVNLLLFSRRIENDAETARKIELLLSMRPIVAEIKNISRELLRTIDTDRARKKMNDEVIPGLMKMGPDIIKRMRDVSFDADVASIEENPEWADMLDKSGIRSQLEQLSEMQSSGADVMMAAFANLKNFPFFRRSGNWFIPFSADHSEIAGVMKDLPAEFTDILDGAGYLCDTDKYSVILSISRMPETQRKLVFGQLAAQISQLGEAKDFKLKLEEENTIRLIAKCFIMRMYRFIKLFDKDDACTPANVFARDFDFASSAILWNALNDADFTRLVGEFYFSRAMYTSALPYLKKLETGGDMAVLEKIGYCFQKTGDFGKAYECYEKAALLNPDSKWLTRRRAQVAARLGRYDEAASHYEALLKDAPSDKTLLMHQANALYAAGRIADALSLYYNLSFLDENDFNSRRAIAWCELLLGHYDKSRDEYSRLLLSQPIGSDWLNAGHLELLEGRIKEAIGYYREAVNIDGIEAFDRQVAEDLPTLQERGISGETFSLIRDYISTK